MCCYFFFFVRFIYLLVLILFFRFCSRIDLNLLKYVTCDSRVVKVIPNPILVTIEDRSRIFRTTIWSAIVNRDSKFSRYQESLLLFSSRCESTIPCYCIHDRLDAHYLIWTCTILDVCRSILPVLSHLN